MPTGFCIFCSCGKGNLVEVQEKVVSYKELGSLNLEAELLSVMNKVFGLPVALTNDLCRLSSSFSECIHTVNCYHENYLSLCP